MCVRVCVRARACVRAECVSTCDLCEKESEEGGDEGVYVRGACICVL